jgi:hypothetical protein
MSPTSVLRLRFELSGCRRHALQRGAKLAIHSEHIVKSTAKFVAAPKFSQQHIVADPSYLCRFLNVINSCFYQKSAAHELNSAPLLVLWIFGFFQTVLLGWR